MPSPYIPERNLRAKQNSRKERKGRRDFANYYRQSLTAHPLTAHRSPLTAHRSPLTSHRSPFTSHRSPTTVRHKTENPQTLAITGVPADDVLLQNR